MDIPKHPKVVSGIDDRSAAIDVFYRSLVDTTVVISGTRVAEMTKFLENTFRHVNIALVNELAMFAGELGVGLWDAIEAASTKPFGFMPRGYPSDRTKPYMLWPGFDGIHRARCGRVA